MLSSLTSLVPSLAGAANYTAWAPAMKSYLMVQGQWRLMGWYPTAPTPPTEPATDATEAQKEKYDTAVEKYEAMNEKYEEDLEKWEDNNAKALGNITLRLHHQIAFNFRDEHMAYKVWEKLEQKYGKPGPSVAYIEFRKALNLVIPGQSDPSLALDTFVTHFG